MKMASKSLSHFEDVRWVISRERMHEKNAFLVKKVKWVFYAFGTNFMT